MLHKTRGIVFKVTDYQEASVIVQVFTEKFGLRSYLINGVRKPKAKITRNMLQPLHLLDLVVYHKAGANVERIKEIKNSPTLQSIPYDIVKSSVTIFLNEVLYKAVKQQTADELLFNYIFNSVAWLDHAGNLLANFHLIFLMKLTRYLGFYPHNVPGANEHYFDMSNGIFTGNKPEGIYLSPPHTQYVVKLLEHTYEDMHLLKISNDERRYLLGKLLDYFALHVEGFGNIRSNQILEEILA